jgi:hypothetical protein
MKRDSTFQYNHFIDYNINIVKSFFDRFHELYIRKQYLFHAIAKNEEYLKFINFPFDAFVKSYTNDKEFTVSTSNYPFNSDIKNAVLKSNINQYCDIINSKMPEYLRYISRHTFLSNIPYSSFIDIYSELNLNISKTMLRARTYRFNGKGLIGDLRIVRYPRNFKKLVADYRKTNIRKQQGEENYVSYHLDDEYCAPVFVKKTSKVRNYKLYRFYFTAFINTSSRQKIAYYESDATDEEVLNNKLIGNREKMLCMIHRHGHKFYKEK